MNASMATIAMTISTLEPAEKLSARLLKTLATTNLANEVW